MKNKPPQCVQCHGELEYTVNDEVFSKSMFVCHNQECPNYGLLAVCLEKMKEAVNDH